MQNVFVSHHPLIAHKLAKLRDVDTDPRKFRDLVHEIAILLAYEATADMQTEPTEVQTPLAKTVGSVIND